jgi:vacuolar-type H+-ATPase subunit I/STV1
MAKERGVGLGISGFTLGIVSLAILLFNPFLGILASVIGLVFCIIQQRKKPTKLGKAGLIINIAGLVLNIVVFYLYITVISDYLAALEAGALS